MEDWRRAVKAYRRSIELDPGFAAAYAGLAVSEYWVADFTGDIAGYSRALSLAEKAVALAPMEADGYAARGYLRRFVSWDWSGATTDAQKALALDPGSNMVQRWLAGLLGHLGRFPEAITASKKAIELDPLSFPAWETLAGLLIADRQFAAANDVMEHVLEISPDSFISRYDLGQLQLLEGKAAAAAATFREVRQESLRLTGTSMAEHALGHTLESQRALDELIAKCAQFCSYQVAEVYAWRGERDKAFEWLERAYRQRDTGLVGVKIDPGLASLHGDPRYGAFLRKMKLPEN